jgi:hypothetical protein
MQEKYAELVKELSKELDARLIQHRQESWGNVPYLDGATVIMQANRIFGFGNWERKLIIPPTKTDEGYYCAMKIRVKIPEVGFIEHEDVGYCSKTGNEEAAIKGCVTDAMKRCFRAFGAQFGNELEAERSTPTEAHKQSAKREGSNAETVPGTLVDFWATEGERHPWEVEFLPDGNEESDVLPCYVSKIAFPKGKHVTCTIVTSAAGKRYIKSMQA